VIAVPPTPVTVHPTSELRTLAPVNEVTVDNGRAATLVGTVRSWEYVLVWTPHGVVVRASLSCDTQESNLVLAGNRFAHLCYQGTNYLVAGTIRPLHAAVTLRASPSAVISLVGGGSLVAGSVGFVAPVVSTVIWRFDARSRRKLRTHRSRALLVSADGGKLLIDRPHALDVLSVSGALLSTLNREHDGGAVLRAGRVATINEGRLVISGIHGESPVVRRLAPRAHLEDVDGNFVLYSVDTRLHLLRLSDRKDVALRLPGQFGYAHAHLWRNAVFYAYNQSSGTGRVGFVDAQAVRALLASS
jgi:hypothetical protein